MHRCYRVHQRVGQRNFENMCVGLLLHGFLFDLDKRSLSLTQRQLSLYEQNIHQQLHKTLLRLRSADTIRIIIMTCFIKWCLRVFNFCLVFRFDVTCNDIASIARCFYYMNGESIFVRIFYQSYHLKQLSVCQRSLKSFNHRQCAGKWEDIASQQPFSVVKPEYSCDLLSQEILYLNLYLYGCILSHGIEVLSDTIVYLKVSAVCLLGNTWYILSRMFYKDGEIHATQQIWNILLRAKTIMLVSREWRKLIKHQLRGNGHVYI